MDERREEAINSVWTFLSHHNNNYQQRGGRGGYIQRGGYQHRGRGNGNWHNNNYRGNYNRPYRHQNTGGHQHPGNCLHLCWHCKLQKSMESHR